MSFPQIGGSAFGFGFQGPEFITGGIERNWARSDAEDAMLFSAQSAQRQMQFQADMSGSAYQRAVADMAAAGLNPMLAYQQGGASSPQGAGFPGVLPHRTGFGSLGGSGSGDLKFLTAAQVANLNAQTSKTEAEEKEVIARTPTHAVSMEKMRQEMAESQQRILGIVQQIETGKATAAMHQASAEKFRAQIPEIEQHIKLMREHVRLYQQQVKTGSAEELLLRQRWKEDLPVWERQLKEVEYRLQRLKVPNAEISAHEVETLPAIMGRLMRSMNPFLNRGEHK